MAKLVVFFYQIAGNKLTFNASFFNRNIWKFEDEVKLKKKKVGLNLRIIRRITKIVGRRDKIRKTYSISYDFEA
jgi:hypothetical protein